MIGIELRKGMPSFAFVISSLISPPITIVWPSWATRFVVASVLRIDANASPAILDVIALLRDLLGQLKRNQAAVVYLGFNLEDNADVFILNCGRSRIRHRSAAGQRTGRGRRRKGDLRPYLNPRLAVVRYKDMRGREYLGRWNFPRQRSTGLLQCLKDPFLQM